MKLSALLAAAAAPLEWDGRVDPEISGLSYDSRRVAPGDLFAAIAGQREDGHAFITDAVAGGAAAVLAARRVQVDVPVVCSPDPRRTLGQLAAAFYGRPAESLFVVGITGTNGKTTTSWLVEAVLAAAGHRVGVIGTVDWHYPGKREANPVTTPQSLDLQRILAEMRSAGVSHVVMEVSSHALDQDRVEGVLFDVGVFTNLTRDHLDYHGSMEAYRNCKQRLFTERLPTGPKAQRAMAVVNTDDPFGRDLAERVEAVCLTVGSGPANKIHPVAADISITGIQAELATPAGRLAIRSPLVGRHNLDNIMAAAACGIAAGAPLEAIGRGIEAVTRIPGRLEPVFDPDGRHIYVDYAHTPDALDHALAAMRPLTPGRLICVFGCGGDRDAGKRPQMGEIAGRWSDYVVVTSDNPRSEVPEAIIEMILPGLRRVAAADSWEATPDRATAIRRAIAAAGPGDTVLIAGKGHETYQVLADRTIAFDDRQEAQRALGLWPAAAGVP
ncbi:MAG TPA: UDP-N-acetylmuramoyl-L-alanyl-D-glutamate--2,6-diaminopimelate ligase [Desulfobacteraceae bacterium]|nr:UDP-N-acetylmuramoyl-L-alanyl-D-glutamate--2,6-diaminopimelate ligase [Deltaproteobacteria bacterium]RLB98616.1 MAG: UDP-N-acetylmuramoyl-L-alanyl-D-glutamate--2,6-diaminopimelate ligase [Deltaproteobacteria bacterium]HDI60809.1 UDP-N-acetylmuramoyl-L-alanyl-D-glutamate--2,6-diaminopimelate ligase [Desulfobacteraceae bacterium]